MSDRQPLVGNQQQLEGNQHCLEQEEVVAKEKCTRTDNIKQRCSLGTASGGRWGGGPEGGAGSSPGGCFLMMLRL